MRLFSLDGFEKDNLISIVKDACVFDFSKKNTKKTKKFIVGILFFEPSTRTRYSFEIASKRLGFKTITFAGDALTSIAKGESLFDTVKTFENIGVDALVIRHPQKEYYKELKNINVPILSGGDGDGNHPTQSLLDLVTIYQEFQKFEGLKIAIIGDIKHSRVANTNIAVMRKLGMQVNVVCPKQLASNIEQPIAVEKAIKESDVLMALRVQLERHQMKFDMSNEEYNKHFGLNQQNIKHIKQNAIIMHPGPINWGVELDKSIMSHPASRIDKQVENGIKVRAVLLERALKCT